MRLVLAVFDALQRLGRPVSRIELEKATGFVADEVYGGLRGLRRRDLLLTPPAPRCRQLYSLVPNAERPVDLRGTFSRTDEHRRLKRELQRARLAAIVAPAYSPACSQAGSSQPGVLRVAIRGVRGAARGRKTCLPF